MTKSYIAWILAAGLAVWLWKGDLFGAGGGPAPEIRVGQWINEPAGTSLADLRGRVVFLEFWASW